MSTPRICERCGKPLSETATENICPACIAQLGQAPWLAETAATVVLADASRPGPANPSAATSGATEIRQFGDYKLVEEIARGGMGVVYKARQVSLDRIVAVKMILAGQFAGKQITQRFRGEATAAAVLHHPNIVAVHEVGVHEGHHFFSMDYVEGQNLAQLVGNRPLPARQAARYLKLLAEAIHYAHGQGILHRDLKPSNVLVEAATDQPRVTDFGLAKRLDAESSLTMSGQMLGSPHFMPPEQASGGRGKVGRHSDVFGLGAVLYFLLTARAPFQGETLETTISQVLHADPVSPRLLNPAVSADLETICLKCLEKEPERRYATAQEVADELGRFLQDEPIQARPVTRAERAWRWCRRKPAVASLSAISAVLLLAVAIGGPIAAVRIAQGRQEARSKAVELEENLYFNHVALAYRDVTANQPVRALKLLAECPQQLRGWEWHFVRNACHQTEQPLTNLNGKLRSIAMSSNGRDLAVIVEGELQLRELSASGEMPLRARLGPAPETSFDLVSWLAFRPDGALLAAVSTNFTVKLWNVAKQSEVRTFLGHTNLILSVTFHPSGHELVTAGDEPFVRVWDVESGKHIRTLEVGLKNWRAQGIACSPDGRFLAAGTWGQNMIMIWDARTGVLQHELTGHLAPVFALAFSHPDGLWLASGSFDQSIKVWDLSNYKAVTLTGHSGGIQSVAFTRGGKRLASSSFDRDVKIWEPLARREVLTLKGHSDIATAVAFTPDDTRLISGGFDGGLRVWDAAPPKASEEDAPVTLSAHTNRVWSVAFHPDGRLFSASEDLNGQAWDTSEKPKGHQFDTSLIASVSLDGRHIISIGASHGDSKSFLKLFDAFSLREHFRAPVDVSCASLSPDGEFLVAGDSKGELWVWNWRKSEARKLLGRHETWVNDVEFSPKGNHLASLGEDGLVKLWDTTRLLERQKGRDLLPATPLREFGCFAFSPDGRCLAVADGSDGVIVVDVDTGQTQLRLKRHGGIVMCVTFSPDGRYLASGGTDSAIKLWDANTGHCLRTWLDHRGEVHSLAFSPDSGRLASGSHDHTVKLRRINATQR